VTVDGTARKKIEESAISGTHPRPGAEKQAKKFNALARHASN
jgi:hypothetical protein